MKEIIISILIAIFLIGFLVWCIISLSIISAKRYEWLTAHCEVIAKTSGSYGVGNTFTDGKVGVGTIYIPGKTTYKCDDGVIYTE